MNKEEITITAIRYEKERITSSTLQQFATTLLDEGVSTPSWMELATIHDPVRSEMLGLLRTALTEIQTQMPPASEWCSVLLRRYIQKVAVSGENARQALQVFMDEG